MTNQTIGERIAQLRRKKNITQEAMAEQLGVTPQAVSKWENDISCPDITLLPPLAALLGVTVDELLGCEEKPAATLLPEERRKPLSEMIFRIYAPATRLPMRLSLTLSRFTTRAVQLAVSS